MTFAKLVMTAAVALATSFASASVVRLNFEGVGNGAQVLAFYNGGQDSQGNSGSNLGVAFSSTAVGVDCLANMTCSNEPSPKGIMTIVSTGSVSSTFNVAGGFSTGFSTYYSSVGSASLTVFDALNGAGNILATLSLSGQATTGCSDTPFCNWTEAGTLFSGTAKSVVFTGVSSQTGFDNMTFGCNSFTGCAGNEVPEPTTLALTGLALLGLGVSRRRKQTA